MKRHSLIIALVLLATTSWAQQPKPLVITTETKFIDLPDESEWVSPLDEGVWSVEHQHAFAFFLLDGSMLYDFNWQTNSSFREPKMSNGAVIMYKKGETYNKPQYILYRDGSVKELPADYTGPATNFVDGVALIGKKRNGSGYDYIYINVKGERVYGDLVSLPDRVNGENYTLPPLRDGLRAFKSAKAENFVHKWGFIDANGKVVIPARFEQCRSFSDGYALVKENGKIFFIDKKGNKVFEPNWESDIYFTDVSDVRNGIFVVNTSPRSYYNMKGEKLFEGKQGSWFYDGYAFINDPQKPYDYSIVIDQNFHSLRRVKSIQSSWDDNGCTPVFTEAGVAIANHDCVIAPDGTILICHYPLVKKNANSNGIENFTKSGFAKAWLDHNGVRYHGFINTDGEFVIIYEWDRNAKYLCADPNNPISSKNPLPIIIDPTVDPGLPIRPVHDPPIGPLTTTRQNYTVTVTASPAKGGTVKGSGTYHLGDKVPLSAVAAKGWEFTEWKCNTPGFYGSIPDNVIIEGHDLSFTANFIETPKKDSINPVTNSGAFGGHCKVPLDKNKDFYLDYDIYMELSADKNIESPYGKSTYGYLTCVFDGTKQIVVPQNVNGTQGSLKFKVFYVPMKISGLINDPNDGKRYLVLDGGQVLVSDIFIDGDLLAALYVNTMFAMEGTFGTASNARYRLELTSFDEATGECTFGNLYRFHKKMGWVLAEDYPVEYKHSFFYTKSENVSISSDFFRGVHMKPCAKRAIEFVPPKGWIEKGYDDAVKAFLNELGNTVTEWDECFNAK